MRLDGTLHVTGTVDVVALIDKLSHVALERSDPPVTNVLPGLGLAEVVAPDVNANAITKTGQGQDQICTMVAPSIIWPQECFCDIWSQGLYFSERVLYDWQDSEPILSAVVHSMDEAPSLEN